MRIGVLTSGGDAPGMNAAIRGVVRVAAGSDIEVFGIERGYKGLLNNEMLLLSKRSVSGMIQRGGTMLMTARCPEFNEYEYRRQAAEILTNRHIDGLVVIGGDGSFHGMEDLWREFGVRCVGIPGTIDNDLAYTDFTLGFDTAVNTAVSAINNLRDTMSSHERVVVVQVMGRHCGDIALYAGIAGGAEVILVPEHPVDYDEVTRKLIGNKKAGKQSGIIVLAEGAAPVDEVIREIKARTPELTVRSTVLGYIQRGGAPTMSDRLLASKMAYRAVELLKEGKGGRVVGIRDNHIIDEDVTEALARPRRVEENLYKLANLLSV